jgi:GNAT superfamily N-acetyltransferase
MATPTILMNATESELAQAVEENLFDLFRAVSTLTGGQVIETDRLCKHLAFPGNPMFKGVWKTRLSEANSDAAIDETLAWFREQNTPFIFWWTSNFTTPGDLGERLMARGMLSYEAQQETFAPGIRSTDVGAPGMVADLHRMNEAILTQTPPNFEIEIAQDQSALDDFKRVFIEGYGVPEWAAQAWVDATLAVGIGKTPWTIYVGRLDGEPVAITMLFNGAGVASVYAVATSPAARGKGIGAAITLKPLLDARDQGYHYGVLFASEMGVPVYERIGFRLAPIRINRYLWRSE